MALGSIKYFNFEHNKFPMDQEIEDISRKISEESRRIREEAERLRGKRELIHEVDEGDLNCSFTGVDGGLIVKKFHGIHMVVTRAYAARMSYSENKLKEVNYFPNLNRKMKLYPSEPNDSNKKPSLLRALEEVDTAIKSIRDTKTDYLLMDGSIVPRPSDKPRAEKEAETVYKRLIEKYQELFTLSQKEGVQVVGVVEDSKARVISAREGIDTIDTVLLNYVLRSGERTETFSYSRDVSNHPVLRSFPREISEKIKGTYLKVVEEDRPLRIEYLESFKEPSEITRDLNAVSKVSRDYSYPAPLIEADLRAKLTEKEASMIVDRVRSRVGEDSLLMDERRNKRPFK